MSVRRFDGMNFNFWKVQMDDYLIVCGQIDPIEPPTSYTLEEWAKVDRIARATIWMYLPKSVYYTM
jgi:hypothetical protein